MSDNDVTLTKNETANRFELRVGENLVGLIDYRALASGAVAMSEISLKSFCGS